MDTNSYEYGNVIENIVAGCNYLRRKARKPYEHRDVKITNKMRALTGHEDGEFADAKIDGNSVRVFKPFGALNWQIHHRLHQQSEQSQAIAHMAQQDARIKAEGFSRNRKEASISASRRTPDRTNDVEVTIKKTRRIMQSCFLTNTRMNG